MKRLHIEMEKLENYLKNTDNLIFGSLYAIGTYNDIPIYLWRLLNAPFQNNKFKIIWTAKYKAKDAYAYIIDIEDFDFSKLCTEHKISLILHEVGHIFNDHVEENLNTKLKISNLLRCFGFGKFEFEADEYAASIVGYYQIIDALYYIMYNINGVAKLDIRGRINHLLKMSM